MMQLCSRAIVSQNLELELWGRVGVSCRSVTRRNHVHGDELTLGSETDRLEEEAKGQVTCELLNQTWRLGIYPGKAQRADLSRRGPDG